MQLHNVQHASLTINVGGKGGEGGEGEKVGREGEKVGRERRLGGTCLSRIEWDFNTCL